MFDLQRLNLSLSLTSGTIFEVITKDLLMNANIAAIATVATFFAKVCLPTYLLF